MKACLFVFALMVGAAGAHACEVGMLVEHAGQLCYEGWNDYPRAQEPSPVADCPEWHDETPGALAEHCPLVMAPPAPEKMPDWHDEAPRLPPLPTVADAPGPTQTDEVAVRVAND